MHLYVCVCVCVCVCVSKYKNDKFYYFITLTQNYFLKLLQRLILSKENTVCLYSDAQ